MSLSDALKAENTKRGGQRCGMCRLLETLPKDDLASLTAALTDSDFTSSAISRALRTEGHPITEQTISRHRRGVCIGADV